MQTFKPLLLGAALAAGFVWVGAVAAAQPLDTANQASPVDSTSAMATQLLTTHARKVYFFPLLDRDHNGRLRRSEIPSDMHDLRRHFMEADFDQDGELTPQEYILYARGTAPAYTTTYHVATYVYASNGQ